MLLFIGNDIADIDEEVEFNLTYNVDDISQFGKKNFAYSKEFKLAGTANNALLFNRYFNVQSITQYSTALENKRDNFNSNDKVRSKLVDDGGITLVDGYLKLNGCVYSKGEWSYSVTIFSSLLSFSDKVKSLRLKDLQLSDANSVYDLTRVSFQWDNAFPAIPPAGWFVYADNGLSAVDNSRINFLNIRRAINLKYILKRLIENAGFIWANENETDFEKPIYYYPSSSSKSDDKTKVVMSVSNIFDFTRNYFSSPDQIGVNKFFLFNTQRSLISFSPQLNGTENIFQNNASAPAIDYLGGSMLQATLLSFAWEINIDITIPPSGDVTLFFDVEESGDGVAWINTATYSLDGVAGVGASFFGAAGSIININRIVSDATYSVSAASFNARFMRFSFRADKSVDLRLNYIQTKLRAKNAGTDVPVFLSYNANIIPSAMIDPSVTQGEFFNSISNMFNLMIVQDKIDPDKIFIYHWRDFYKKNISDNVDWSSKVDRSKDVEVLTLHDFYSKQYNFSFEKEKTISNDRYLSDTSKDYGDLKFLSQVSFGDEKKEVKVKLSASPLSLISNRYIMQLYKDNNGLKEIAEGLKGKIIFCDRVSSVMPQFENGSGALINLPSPSGYGYGGHYKLDDTQDLLFGAPSFNYFGRAGNLYTSNNLFNVYWSSYINQLINDSARFVKLSVYLTNKDIDELDFRRLIYIDGQRYILNKIIDYNPYLSGTSFKVELLKYIE